MVKRLECMTYKASLRQLSLRREGQKWGSNCCLNYLLGSYRDGGGTFFLAVSSQRGNRDKLQEGNSDSEKNSLRAAKDRNKLSKEPAETSSLQIFKTQLDKTLSNLI